MRIGDSRILESGAGGIFRDWIYDLYKDTGDPLSEATAAFKWIYNIYEKEHRVDRLVNRLLAIEKSLQAELAVVHRSRIYRIGRVLKRVRRRVANLRVRMRR